MGSALQHDQLYFENIEFLDSLLRNKFNTDVYSDQSSFVQIGLF